MNALNNNAVTCTYAWGLDLSGSWQGAGGVNGLLFSSSSILSSPLHAPCYDGNGNIIGYVDMASGTKSATYDYNAFGETIIADGPVKDAFVFRFSTKYQDVEIGLYYYGLRYYQPSTGRWLSRDPIEEQGGINLYDYVSNNPVNAVDPLGLDTYYINRDLSVLGSSSRSRANIVTHTFVATTNPDGSINHTYSWGNDANLRGWNLDQPLDLMTAQQAVSRGQAQRAGADSLDPFIAAAFANLNKPENEHANLFVAQNCKVEAHNLVSTAKQKELEAAISNFFRGLLDFNFEGIPGRPRFGPQFENGGGR